MVMEDLIARLEAFAIVSKMEDFSDAANALKSMSNRIAELESDLKTLAALHEHTENELWNLNVTSTAEIKKLNNENAFLERIIKNDDFLESVVKEIKDIRKM